MSQDSYDKGYEDGRRSRDAEIEDLTRQWEFARADLAKERDEAARLRAIVYRIPVGADDSPF